MLLANGMMGPSGRRSSLDPDWLKFHGIHTKGAPKGRFDTNSSSSFQAAQPFQRTTGVDSHSHSTILSEDQVSGDGKVTLSCNIPFNSTIQELASPRLDENAPLTTSRISSSRAFAESNARIAPSNPSPHSTFTSTNATADIHSHRTAPDLEDSTLHPHSCPSNHADSYGSTSQPERYHELHHMSTTNTDAVDSHDRAMEVSKHFSDATLPLMREENPLPPMALESERRAKDEPSTVRKRDTPGNDGEDLDGGGPCSRTALPMGLRNKRMKPTDCLLYAATLLSKVDVAAHRNGSTLVPKPAAPMDTASNASLDDLSQPREVDVLCGRGGLINKHPGNVVYRKVVDYNKPYYQSVHKKHRILVSQSIVQSILNFGGRFLTLGAKSKTWMEIGYKRAVQKTSQALRERSAAQEDDDDDEEDDADEDSANYRKKKGSPDSKEEVLDKYRWEAQTNLKKTHERFKGS